MGQPQVTSAGEMEVDADDQSIYFGYVRGNIVGIRYYNGMVSNQEMVAFVREPQNPYDSNAVRVDNVLGEQVGHIKRNMAQALAQVVDRGLAAIEGLVPFGSKNTFSIPVEISFWGSPTNKEAATRTMRSYGFTMNPNLPNVEKPKKGAGRRRDITDYMAAQSRATIITPDQMKNELSELFEKLEEADQTAEEEAAMVVKSKLYKHQKQALAWMRKREAAEDLPPFWTREKPNVQIAVKPHNQTIYHNTVTNFSTTTEPKRVKGGILADDMGLGKTLVTICLILGNTWDGSPMHVLLPVANSKAGSSAGEVIDLTLDDDDVIEIPSEDVKITKGTDITQFSVTPDQKPRAAKLDVRDGHYLEVKQLHKSDDSPNEDSKRCSTPSFLPTKIEDTPLFKKAQIPKLQPRSTLLICPLSLMRNWLDQIDEHVHKEANVDVLVYHGAAKAHITMDTISQCDIVITTYQTLAHDFKRSADGQSLLHRVEWLRVVLDEGHIVRNPKAQQSKACFALNARRKWVLTGTPIQNSIKDLWSVISFLGIEPFTDVQWWKRTIERPIGAGEADALKRVRCLLGKICMRRTKRQKINGQPIVILPKKEVFLQTINLNPKEREIYNKMNHAGKLAVQKYIKDKVMPNKYADVLVMLMRLRQICCHTALAKEAIAELQKDGAITDIASKELATKLLCILESGCVDECCVCLDSLTMPVITRCHHVFCKLCICGVIANDRGNSRCPLCRGPVKEEDLVEAPVESDEVKDVSETDMQSGSKLDALMHELLRLDKEKPQVKSLVVSQFTEYLKIIENHLVASNISCVLYHGGLNVKSRTRAIRQLQCGPAKVMLLALKAGGVGLNLTAASQVFLMEPSWNPAAEDQCCDRVYRLGQKNPVRIVKYVCTNTVEERMVELQTKKREIAKASLQRPTADERKQQTVSDLQQLMGV